MTDHQDVQRFVDETHDWAESLLGRGACPACLAQAMIAEGFYLAQSFGALSLAREQAERYTGDNGGQAVSQH